MDVADKLAALRDASAVHRCPDCGYAREGLPRDHTCPECGWTPHGDELIFYAEAATRTTAFDVRPWLVSPFVVILLVIASIVGLIIATRLFVRRTGLDPGTFFMMLSAAVVVGIVAWHRYSRGRLQEQEVPGAYQFRISPKGYSIRAGFGRAAWHPWPVRAVIRMDEHLFGKSRPAVGVTASKYGHAFSLVDRPSRHRR